MTEGRCAVTPAGRRHRRDWRVTWYLRDPQTGKPVGGGRRAFVLQQGAERLAAEKRAEGYTTEVWREDTLPGVG